MESCIFQISIHHQIITAIILVRILIIRTFFRNLWVQSKPFGCLRFAIFCKLKVIVESLEGLWQWQGSRSYHLEISKSGSLGPGRFLTTGCSRFFLEMVHEDDFYLPKSKSGRGGRRQPIWRAASVEEFDSGSLPRLVISSRRRLRSESARRPGWREQAGMKKRWGGDVF